MSSMKMETAPPAGQSLPLGDGKKRQRRREENDLCVVTHRSLEGLDYLGMLSAAPTDMDAACMYEGAGGSEKPQCGVPPFAIDLFRSA